MDVRKEVDIILIIVFVVLFFSLGSYVGVKEKKGEKAIDLEAINVWDVPDDYKEDLPKKNFEEMPAELIVDDTIDNFKIIEIKDTKFNPSELNISVGTIVYWVNQDPKRNYQVYEKSANQKFNSFQLKPYESFEYTFDKAGVYKFGDGIFTFMNGKITVS